MSYEISYAELLEKDPMKAEREAIIDSIRYTGKRIMKLILLAVRNDEFDSFEQFRLLLNIQVGISGYPVKAIWDYAHRRED